MKILIINGPNLNLLGKRDKKHYGSLTLAEINKLLLGEAKKLKCHLKFVQSNHEGELINFIQKEGSKAEGILINPGGLTHTSVSLLDALLDSGLPVVEVHLSDIAKREKFRKIMITSKAAKKVFKGEKEKSYIKGLRYLVRDARSCVFTSIKNGK